ncbi:MAG: hypothetical protein IIA49_01660 [Bacteroidetes bacterium]|nr:hypothetical protein [Bacteroidota bacterium]
MIILKHKQVINLLLISFPFAFINAQDSHYWSNQYGTEASLLGGLVVGSKHDLSSTFYNPGSLALTTDQILTISSDAFQITQIDVTSNSQDTPNLESRTSGTVPGIIAFRLPFEELGKHQIAFSLLVRDEVKTDFYGRDINRSGLTGVTANDGIAFQNYSETWLGFSWGYKIEEFIGIGISQYVAIRSQRQRIQVINQEHENSLTAAASLLFSDVFFNNFKILWKAGILFDHRPLSFGFAVTTPSLNLFNYTGEASLNISQINSAVKEQFIAVSDQRGLDSEYKTPFSIAAGAAYYTGSTSIYFTAEWFASLSQYEVLNTKPVSVLQTGDVIPNRNLLSRRPVFNYGVGVNHKLGSDLSLYGSIFTNNSARESDLESKYSLSSYNILHFLGGAALKYKIIDLILGLGYAFGNDNIETLGDIINPDNSISSSAQSSGAEVTYRNYKIVFAFSLKL